MYTSKKLDKKDSNTNWYAHRIRYNLLGPRFWKLHEIPRLKITEIWEYVFDKYKIIYCIEKWWKPKYTGSIQ